jgi:hypothetical protein
VRVDGCERRALGAGLAEVAGALGDVGIDRGARQPGREQLLREERLAVRARDARSTR